MAAAERHYKALGIVRWARPDVVAAAVPSADPPAKIDPPPPPPKPVVVEAHTVASAPTGSLQKEEASTRSVGRAEDERVARMGWSELRAELARRSRPPAHQGVFGVGAEDAPLFVAGEAPGAEEDRLGEPFVGRAGQLLDAMLLAIGHRRSENVYIANICKFRPPNNRDPRAEEVAEDLPLLLRQIELVKPRLLLAVGRIAAQTLLECETPIGKLRGRLHQHEKSGLPMIVTYHPAYLLRSPLQKAKAWADLKRVLAELG